MKKETNTLYSIFNLILDSYEDFINDCLEDVKDVLFLTPIQSKNNLEAIINYFNEIDLLVNLLLSRKKYLNKSMYNFVIHIKTDIEEQKKLFKLNKSIAKNRLKMM